MATGRVVGIVKRNWHRSFVVTIQENAEGSVGTGAGKVTGIPYDCRIPKIRFTTSNRAALHNDRLLVRIDAWPVTSPFPEGHLIRSLGPIGNIGTETEVILIENDIMAPPFSENLIRESPADSEPWPAEEVTKRRDLRHSDLIFRFGIYMRSEGLGYDI